MKAMYFDYAATTPCDPEVIKAMEPFLFEHFGNASSPHKIGRYAQKVLEDARANVADFIGADSSEIVFNSGATEGNNHAIFGVAQSQKDKGKHIIVSGIEHHSVLEPVEYLESQGFAVTRLDVDTHGMVDPQSVADAITDQTILVGVMHASNEIGTIQPISAISAITTEKNIPFLVDACQTVGHIPVDVKNLNCDLLTCSAHKFYGPKGVGAMYIKKKTPVGRILMGGDQERDQRASTQNVSGIVGLSKAIDVCRAHMDEETKTQSTLRDQLIQFVLNHIEDAQLNGHATQRLPNNAHFSFQKLEGEALLMSLDMQGMCASMGSACTSGAMEPSHVLRALGLDDDIAYGSLRISLGRWTTAEHIQTLQDQLPDIIKGLRRS